MSPAHYVQSQQDNEGPRNPGRPAETAAMSNPISVPYGSWKSPITSDLIVAELISLSEIQLDGNASYWLEGRPREAGRYVLVCQGVDGQKMDVVPAPFNVRTRVHEYGGGAYAVSGGVAYFSHFK